MDANGRLGKDVLGENLSSISPLRTEFVFL